MKLEKIHIILNYVAAMIYYIMAIMNFASNKEVAQGIFWLCLGTTWLCLGSVDVHNNKKKCQLDKELKKDSNNGR